MIRLDHGAWRALSRHERMGYRFGQVLRESDLGNRMATAWLNALTQHWMMGLSVPISHVDGVEHVPLHRSYILAANHRTYFDFHATIANLWWRYEEPPLLYCPVRSEFFYDHPLGPLFNMLICGYAMYPPVFRDDRGKHLNHYAVRKCVELLHASDRAILAIHPEGRRNKDPDPYRLGRPKPGVGRIALASRAPVIPLFINGLAPSFPQQVVRRFRPSEPIRVFFGPPVDFGTLYDDPENPDAWQSASRRVMDAITACAARERAWMSAAPN